MNAVNRIGAGKRQKLGNVRGNVSVGGTPSGIIAVMMMTDWLTLMRWYN